jgi:hypothetical protein
LSQPFLLHSSQINLSNQNMIQNKFILLIVTCCACVSAATLNAATIPAGTTLTVSTVSLISSQTVVGRSFEAKIAQDVSVKGNVVLKAATKAFGKVTASRANPRKSGPLTVELDSIDLNGRRIAVKTNSIQPEGPPQTARQARYGHTAGTTVVNPGTKMQFQLAAPLNL